MKANWKPINTAPKNQILLLWEDWSRVCIGRYNEKIGHWTSPNADGGSLSPTYWDEMPSAPEILPLRPAGNYEEYDYDTDEAAEYWSQTGGAEPTAGWRSIRDSLTPEEPGSAQLVRLYKIHSMILLLEEYGDSTMSHLLPPIRDKMMELEMEQ